MNKCLHISWMNCIPIQTMFQLFMAIAFDSNLGRKSYFVKKDGFVISICTLAASRKLKKWEMFRYNVFAA